MKRTNVVLDLDMKNRTNLIWTVMLSFALFFAIIGMESATAFWEMPQVIEETPEHAWNLQADVTCRINDYTRFCSDPGIHKPGVDGWLSYTSYDEQGTRKVFVKNYRFNNKYPRDDAWGSTIMVSNPVSQACWGQSIKGFNYVSEGSASSGVPAAYVTYFIDQATYKIGLSIITDEGDEMIPCAPFILAGTPDAASRTHIEMAGKNLIVFWDEVNLQTGRRTIMMTDFEIVGIIEPEEEGGDVTYTYEKRPDIALASDIDAPTGLDYQAALCSNAPDGNYLGAVCWRTVSVAGNDEIRAKGFKYAASSGTFLLSAAPQSVPLTMNPAGHTLTQPRLTMSLPPTDIDMEVFVTASWHRDPVGSSDSVINLMLMSVNDANTGWLTIDYDLVEIPVTESSPMYAIAADNGFMRPQNIAYDSATGQLAIAQLSNHRINILDDPVPNTPGVWISESYNDLSSNTGSVTRLADSDIKIRQIGWLAVPETNGGVSSVTLKGFSFPILETDEWLPVKTEELSVSYTDPILEMEMVSDNFSSMYCFFLTSDATGFKISWVCDGLLVRNNGRRDRLTFPYDMDFVPPVWTPTPTPTGSLATPEPTWTPRPDGLWVADMTGHRIVRLNMRGEIMAETHTEDVDPQPTWSEYEHFDVIAPNDVSAAYDGSCWAIDWGRNRVVKVAPNGTMVAFTEPCEVPDPDQCLGELIHPLAIDCAGDPESCFVADYEGNRVYKLTLNGGSIALQVSSAQYYRPKAIAVSRQYEFGQLREKVWVADRWSSEPTPSQSWTFTPVPTPASPTPTPMAGTPTAVQATPTSFPELQRVSQNQFGSSDFFPEVNSTIPITLSVTSNDNNDTYCFIADRDAGRSGVGENFVRWIKLMGGSFEEVDIGKDDGRKICRPVDVESVGVPPTCTPTQTPTP